MDINKNIVIPLILITAASNALSQDDDVKLEDVELATETKAAEKATEEWSTKLDQFGFAPALYLIRYNEEVLQDSKDIRVRGNNTIESSGSESAVNIGVELHYDFSIGTKVKCLKKNRNECKNLKNWDVSTSHVFSPFIGLFDFENGVNGVSLGLIYGYTKGDGVLKNKTTLNFGIGRFIHKDQLVLADDVEEGQAPPIGLAAEDYTERKDIEGITIMVSANIGF